MSDGDSPQSLVVGLVGGSHFVNHAYFMLLPPLFGPLGSPSGLGLTDAQLGLALGTVGFVVTALQLPLGYVSDARGRTLVLAYSLTLGALGAALVATAQSYAWLMAASVVTGAGIAGHHPAHYPLISAATTDATRGRAYSVHGFTGALGFAAPPAVIGLASLAGVDWRWAVGAVAVVGATYGAACLLTFRRRVPETITHGPRARGEAAAGEAAADVEGESSPDAGRPLRALVARVVAGARSLLGSRAVVGLTVLWFVTSVAAWSIKQYAQPLLDDVYGVEPGLANLLVSAMLAVGAVTIFAGGWLTDRYAAPRVLVGGYVALVVAAGLLAWQGLPVAAAIAVVLLLSATIDASRPARAVLGDAFSAADDVGKNFGLLTIGISGGAAVAPPVMGLVVERFDVVAAFYGIAAVGLVCLLLTPVVVGLGAGRRPREFVPGR